MSIVSATVLTGDLAADQVNGFGRIAAAEDREEVDDKLSGSTETLAEGTSSSGVVVVGGKTKPKIGRKKVGRSAAGGKGTSSSSRNVDDDFDDNASVSSSMSSASEHSVREGEKKAAAAKKAVKLKRQQQRCEVHATTKPPSKSEERRGSEDDAATRELDSNDGRSAKKIEGQEASCRDGDADPGGSAAPPLRCTCKKSSAVTAAGKSTTTGKSVTGKSKVKRPEPEGSLLADPSMVGALDDLDRVIYGNEPIFSDLDVDDDPTVDELIRVESDRLHKRITDPDNIFSAVQMLNSNTMIKFAIIQTELRNVKDVSLRLSESEITSASKRAAALIEIFDHSEISLQTVTRQFDEASKAVGPIDSKLLLSSTVQSNVDAKQRNFRLDNVNDPTKFTLSVVDDTSKRRTTTMYGRRLVNEVDIESARCSLEAAEIKLADLEEEIKSISSSRKSRSTSEFENMMKRGSQQLIQADNRAREAEMEIRCLEKLFFDLQDERRGEKRKHRAVSAEINATFAELSIL